MRKRAGEVFESVYEEIGCMLNLYLINEESIRWGIVENKKGRTDGEIGEKRVVRWRSREFKIWNQIEVECRRVGVKVAIEGVKVE